MTCCERCRASAASSRDFATVFPAASPMDSPMPCSFAVLRESFAYGSSALNCSAMSAIQSLFRLSPGPNYSRAAEGLLSDVVAPVYRDSVLKNGWLK